MNINMNSSMSMSMNMSKNKFFALRVTPPAQHRKVPMEALNKNSFKKCQNYKPHGTQIVTRNLQNGVQKPPKWRPKPSKIEPKSSQEGARTTKKSKNNIDPTKRGAAYHSVAPFLRKMWPTWPQLGSQEGAKMKKKSMQKSIKNLMPLGIDFWEDLGRFWEPKWSHVGTQIDQKSM